MFFYDSSMIILIPSFIIAAWAQFKVKDTFERYSKIRSINGYTGSQVARKLLDNEGLYDVPVEIVSGKLSDHYDPVNRVMRLSMDVFNGSSVAAIGVAAHETGHAIQHKNRYAPLDIRNSIFPIVNFSSTASWGLFILGIFLRLKFLVSLGIILFTAVVIFQIITLPVEFDASNRALKILGEAGILYNDEIHGAKSVLNAAALTYVAAVITAVSQLIRLILLSRSRD